MLCQVACLRQTATLEDRLLTTEVVFANTRFPLNSLRRWIEKGRDDCSLSPVRKSVDKALMVIYRSKGGRCHEWGSPSERNIMKRLLVSALLVLTDVCVSRAQVAEPNLPLDPDNAAPDFSATSAAEAKLPLFTFANDASFRLESVSAHTFAASALSASSAQPAAADPPAPSPTPKFVYGSREDYRWQLGLGFAWFRFQSSVFNANAFGEKTTVTYFLNEWLAVEGSLTAVFGPRIYPQNDHSKFVLYGGGPKIAWRQKRWEPWLHGIFGGAHEIPQTTAGSKNSYSIMAGGGADYRWNPRISFRAEGNYVLTGFFSKTQNCFQLSGGIVFHF